ncbi:MAG: TonB family protein [Verrucomicrobiales bacterium]|nr:TonB family protein [Verrucomicrobiales bacterium]
MSEWPGNGEVRLLTTVTLVIWVGCLGVGTLGLGLTYPRSTRAVAPPRTPVRAEVLDVEVARVPLPRTETTLPPLSVALPAPAPPLLAVPEAAPLLEVATPSPAVAFALPVEGPSRVVAPEEADHVWPAASVPVPSAQSAPQPLTFGQGEGNQPAPEYPRAAVRAGQEGTVRVGLTVAENGRVLAAEAVTPCPWPLLNEAAVTVVRQRWRFRPGSVRRYEVAIRFEIQK